MIDNYNIQLLYVELFNKVHFFLVLFENCPKGFYTHDCIRLVPTVQSHL